MTNLDLIMPQWDARRVECRVLDVAPGVAFAAAITADFLDAVRLNPVVRALFAMRSLAERAIAFLRRTPFREPPAPPSLRLIDLPARGEWIRLADDNLELVFGVVGRFWGGETRWETIDATGFHEFSRPGFARIACHLHVTPLNEDSARVTYEARTQATDRRSRRAFLRYWRVVSPFVGIVMRSTLGVIARDAAVATRVARSPAEARASIEPASLGS